MTEINTIDFRKIAEGRFDDKLGMKEEFVSRHDLLTELKHHNLKVPKSKNKFRSDIIDNLDRVLGEITDYDLSNIMMKYKDDLVGDISYIQALLDKYAYIVRHKSVKEKTKFFMDYKPSEAEYFNLLQNRFMLINYIIVSCRELFEYEELEELNNLYFDVDAIDSIYDRIENPKLIQAFKMVGEPLMEEYKRSTEKFIPEDKLDDYSRKLATIELYLHNKYLKEGGTQPFRLNSYFILNGAICKHKYKLLGYGKNKDVIMLATYLNTLVNFIETRNVSNLEDYIRISTPCVSCLHGLYLVNNFNYKNDALARDTLSKEEAEFSLNVKEVLDDLELRLVYDSIMQPILTSLDLYKGNKRYIGLNTHTLFDGSEFYSRKVLLPNSGVLLVTKNDDVTESILIKEIHEDYNSLLSVCVRLKNGLEHSCIIPLSNKRFGKVFICGDSDDNHRSFIDYIFDLLGMVDFMDLAKKHGLSPDMETRKLEYEVLAPIYWKYRDKNYLSPKETANLSRGMKLKREFSIDIAPYIRKINGEPSKEALELARRISLTLGPGYTVVKPHTRTYNRTSRMDLA